VDESWGIRDFRIFIGNLQDADDLDKPNGMWFYTAWAGNDFSTIKGWTAVGASSTKLINFCGADKMVGGYRVFG
jgi:hypothetical protein